MGRSVPHYSVRSKGLAMGRFTPVMNYIRRVLIEEIYGRLSMLTRVPIRGRPDTDSRVAGIMFPESEAWVARADE